MSDLYRAMVESFRGTHFSLLMLLAWC